MQLEVLISIFATRIVCCFNSILVQLEEITALVDAIASLSFQFHIGAIRRLIDISDRYTQLEFQFHIGAIRSPLEKFSVSGISGFNSILVQLEGANPPQRKCGTKCFNSILVQLEEVFREDISKRSHVSIPYWCN